MTRIKTNSVLYILAGSDIGGTESLMLNLCKNANKHKLKPIIILGKKGELYAELGKACCVNHIKRRFVFDPLYLYRVYRLIKKYKIKVVHTHQILECINLFILRIFLGFKLFISIHGYFYLDKGILKRIGPFCIKRINGVFFVSKYLEYYYKKNYALSLNNANVLYNGIGNLTMPSKAENLKRELGLPEDSLLIGTIGNFGKARDYLTAVKAFERVAQKRGKIHYIIIGRSDLSENSDYQKSREFVVNKGLEKNVHFLGARSDASQFLNSFDAFIYSSKRETFGMSVIEALTAGLPTIVNDLPVFQELTERGKYAILYKTKNIEDLSKKLDNMLDDFAFYRNVFNQNSQKVYNKFSIDAHILRLKSFYGKDEFFKI